MKWLFVILACVVPWGAASQELPYWPYTYSADPLVERERASQEPRLIWDPAHRPDQRIQQQRLHLNEGETVTFELAGRAHLRLDPIDGEVPPMLWLSRDGKLWRQASWFPGAESDDWFHIRNDSLPLLARLEARTDFSGRLLNAALDPIDSPDFYQEIRWPQSFERVKLVDRNGDRLSVQRLPGDEVLDLEIEGPRVVAVSTRPDETSPDESQYSISWALNDSPWQRVNILRTQLSTVYQKLGDFHLHGGLDRRFITIPEGRHRLRIKASLPLLARLEEAEEDYFLDFNEPQPNIVELTKSLLAEPLTSGGKPLEEISALSQSNHLEGSADIALGFLEEGLEDQSAGQQALAADIERSQRFYRNLAPEAGAGPLNLDTAWFATTSPLQLDTNKHYYLGEDILDRLGRGLFAVTGKEALNYVLPPRFGPSDLRLAVAHLSTLQGTDLWVQYDNAPARRLRLTESMLDRNVSLPEDTALSQGGAVSRPPLQPTLGGEFAASRESGHYWPTANIILPLPAGVDEVRIWSEIAIPVSLQYRAGQPFEAGEEAYRELVRELIQEESADSVTASFHRALVNVTNPDSEPLSSAPTPLESLENQWYPMLRYLHASQAAYLDDVSAGPQAVSSPDLEQRLKKARAQKQRKNWIGVVEALGRAAYGQAPEAYRLSQQALVELGEHYLAQRQRQATAIFAPDVAARQMATEDLMADYASTQAWQSQVRLLSARYLRENSTELLDLLGNALHRAGDSLWAAQIGLLLAHETDTPAWLGEAAEDAGWLDISGSQTDHALTQDAESIALAITDTDREKRIEGLERWLDWALSSEHEFEWASLSNRLESSGGFSTLFSEITRKPFALPSASTEEPLELEVLGPSVLRVRLSQLAPSTPEPGEIDWLTAELVNVRGRAVTLRAPVLSNTETPYLQVINRNTGVANGDDILLEVPAGLHRVRLRPRNHRYLAQVWQWQPAHQGTALPPATPLALKALLRGLDDRDSSGAVSLSATRPDFMQVHEAETDSLPVLDSSQLHTLELLTPDTVEIRDILATLTFPAQAVRPPGWPVGSYAVQVDAVSTNEGVPESPEAAHALAVALLWGLEKNPGREDRVSVRLAQIAEAHSAIPAIRRLANRRLQGYDWERISSSYESAGVRQLPLQRTMHSPFRRVREALFPPIPASALFLSGRNIEGIEFSNPNPTTIQLRFGQPALPFQVTTPAKVMVQVDDNQPRVIRAGEEGAEMQIPLEAGEHAIRLWLKEPKQQQVVTVQLDLNRSGNRTQVLEDDTRTYHIAAPGRPASFYVRGPAWVRVDRWSQDESSSEYRYVQAGWQSLTFEADGGRDSYYRLYALERAPDARPLEPAQRKADLAAPVPVLPVTSTAPMDPLSWKPRDRHSPGAGLKSWGGYLSLAERIEGSEDDVAPAQGASALEAGVSYRFRQRDRRLFSRSDVLVRKFGGSQNVLGAKQWFDFYPGDSNWHLSLYSDAYLQPEKIDDLDGDNHWSARVQGSIERTYNLSPRLRHKPGITFNQRWLSLDSASSGALANLDPDVFSPYKRDHRRSLTIADRITWMPHLDQRLYLEGALVSNESLNPFDIDHVEFSAAGRQLFRSVAGEAGLRWRHYFDDDDRGASLDRTRFFVGGNLLRWDIGANALTLSAEANYDIDRGDLGWRLRIGYEANAGRLSPARRPGELDFMPLRRAQQRERIEINRLEPVYP